VDRFETVLLDSRFADPSVGYPAYIDVHTFIDYFIVVEITKSPDGYRDSTYMHKVGHSCIAMSDGHTMLPFLDFKIDVQDPLQAMQISNTNLRVPDLLACLFLPQCTSACSGPCAFRTGEDY
jgi:hypothetical protein